MAETSNKNLHLKVALCALCGRGMDIVITLKLNKMELKNGVEQNGFYKLSWAQRIGFGSGDLAQNLIFQTVACYLMLYLILMHGNLMLHSSTLQKL